MTWDFQQCGTCDQPRFRSACAYAQSDQSLCLSLEYSMTLRLLTEYHVEFLSLKGGCTGSSESTLVKMPHCWKSHVVAHMLLAVNENSLHVMHEIICDISHTIFFFGKIFKRKWWQNKICYIPCFTDSKKPGYFQRDSCNDMTHVDIQK